VSQWSTGNIPDCSVSNPRTESHSEQSLSFTALDTGYSPTLTAASGQLSHLQSA